MFRTFTRVTTPILAGVIGFSAFPLRKSQFDTDETPVNEKILEKIHQNSQYKMLSQNPSFTQISNVNPFPKQHRANMVTAGLLYGDSLFEIEPVVFTDHKGELIAFHYLGGKLVSEDGKIHNGITSTILDEGLCAAGFPFLPSKKGVTAKLSVNFENEAPANDVVVLRAKVSDHKGRKVVIDGSIETNDGTPLTIATAKCILVEPKWFKFFSWLLFI